MTLRDRVRTAVAVTASFIVVCGIVIGVQFARMSSEARLVQTHLGPATQAAERLNYALATMDRGLLEYLATSDRSALGPFVAGREDSAHELSTISRATEGFTEFEEIGNLTARTAASRTKWLETVAEPQIALVRGGQRELAAEAAQSGASDKAYTNLQRDAEALRRALDDEESAAFASLLRMNRTLLGLLALIGAALLGLLATVVFGLRSQVLSPLDALRTQVRQLARSQSHGQPIVPSGPPELEAVGIDAELLRQQLVAEIDEATAARQGLEQEVPVVAAIRSALTTPSQPTVQGMQVYGHVAPAEGVLAGDWWDCWTLDDGRAAVVITDVSGHGPQAGIAGLRTRDTMTRLLDAGVAPDAVMSAAAELFWEIPDQFATAVIVLIDPADGSMTWANAGHPLPWVISGSESTDLELVSRLDRTGPLLSAIGGDWTVSHGSLAPGETLLLCTDGLVESHQVDGEQLGDEGLWQVVLNTYRESGSEPPASPGDLVNGLAARARLQAVDWSRDDVTLVAVRRTDDAAQPA